MSREPFSSVLRLLRERNQILPEAMTDLTVQ